MEISLAKMKSKNVPEWIHAARFASWEADTFYLTPEQADENARRLKEKGVNAVILFWRGKGKEYRHIIFDSVLFGGDLGFEGVYRVLKTIIDACHKHGIKVVEHHGIAFVHYNPSSKLYGKTIDRMFYMGKPMKNWCQIDARTKKISMGWYSAYMFCPNNPYYREAIYAHYIPAILSLGVDGIMPDDVQITPDWYVCGCGFCRKKFHRETGYTLPRDGDGFSFWGNFTNPAFRAWINFRLKSTGDFHEDLGKAAYKIKKDLLYFTCSSNDTSTWGAQSTASYYEDWVRGLNATFEEVVNNSAPAYDVPYRVAEAKFYSAIGRLWKIPSIILFYPGSEPEDYLCWSLAKSANQIYWPAPKKKYKTRIRYLLWEKEQRNFLSDCKSMAEIGILFSRQTRDVYGGPEDSYYVNEWMGWCEVMIKNNLQFDVLLDQQINLRDLGKYRLLILPNSACFSEKQIIVVKHFVTNGGNLIASFETSLYDETGKKLPDFSLRDVFGLNYFKTVSEVNLPVSVKENSVVCAGLKGRIENNSPVVFVQAGRDAGKYVKINTEDVTFEYPFLTENRFGRGKALYFSGKPGLMSYIPPVPINIYNKEPSSVWSKTIPEYEKMMVESIGYCLPDSMMKWEKVPRGLMTNSYQKDNKIIIHLINTSSSSLPDGAFVNPGYGFKYGKIKGQDVVLKMTCRLRSAKLLSPELKSEVKLNISIKNRRKISVFIPVKLVKRYAIVILEH